MSLVFNMAGGAEVKLVSLSIKTPPTKTSYTEGERFSASGMVVQATYSNGVTATVTGYSYSPTGALTASNTAITISYTEGGVTVTTEQSIIVKKDYEDNFADNDWSKIADACQKNKVPATWVVGNSKTMTINGKSYQIDIIGKGEDTYDSGGTAPLTFQLHDCYTTAYGMNSTDTNVGGWRDSAMRNTHLPAILALMPEEVRNSIKEVSKKSGVGNKGTSTYTTADKLFLLAEKEVFGSTAHYSVTTEGSQYSYYSAGNSRIKKQNGKDFGWWTRSPHKNTTNGYCFANAYNVSSALYDLEATFLHGVAFAFCF